MRDKLSHKTLESMSQAVWYNQWALNKFKKFLNGKILEVGCGIGNFSKTLSSFGNVWAIDFDKNYLDQTKKMVDNKVRVGFGDIEKGEYFFKNEKFNSIVCINVLEHIKNDKKAIKNMYNLLESEGFLILLIPAYPILYGEIDKSIGHFRRYTKKEIFEKLQRAGFSILQFKTLNLIGALGWFISGRVLKNKVVDQSKIKIFNFLAPFFLRLENLINPFIGTSFLIIAKNHKE